MEEAEECSGKCALLSELAANVPTDFSMVRISPGVFCRKPFPRSACKHREKDHTTLPTCSLQIKAKEAIMHIENKI